MDVRRRTFLGAALTGLAAAASAQEWLPPTPAMGDPDLPAWPPKERLPLWPDGPSGAPAAPIKLDWTMNGPAGQRQLWIRGVPVPEINVYRARDPDGSSVLVIPGGGYAFLSVQNEGINPARELNARRTTAFVLTHRLPTEGWANRQLVPLQDAQRAMRLIRARATDYRIDPTRLGVLGFSAGGHLAADLAVSHAKQTYAAADAAERQSARPAYVGLLYPVTTLIDAGLNSRSMENLLGADGSDAAARARSPLEHVTRDTPPSFVGHAMNDDIVPIAQSLRWAEALNSVGVPVESHFFSEGGHGFGVQLAKDLPGSRWPELFSLWLRKHGG
ncbi:MAG: alpha/beta hydrolase [Pseudomonadota bacterium]|nr:alpha/beta hydrolase [Pseudomonadota bacterium]